MPINTMVALMFSGPPFKPEVLITSMAIEHKEKKGIYHRHLSVRAQTQILLTEAEATVDAALQAAELRKHTANDARCITICIHIFMNAKSRDPMTNMMDRD
ncbi:hypothetical protein EMCRGX_G033292 [Ephydatia muelleri]